MRNIYLTGKHSALLLLSEIGASVDESLYENAGAPETLNFMACVEGSACIPLLESLPSSAPSITRQEADTLANLLNTSCPIEIAVDNPALRRNSKRLRCTVHAASMPKSQYFQIDGELYCASPEASLFSVANTASDMEVIVLASLIQGIFYHDAGGKLLPRRALTTKEKTGAFYERTVSSSHILPWNLARIPKLLSQSVERAASPKEIESALRLGLPFSLGGCELGLPEMNFRVRIPGTNRYRYCDMCWPDHGIAVEYDSESEHANTDSLETDALHRNDLIASGYRAYTLTAGQLNDLRLLNRLANQIRTDMGLSKLPRSRAHSEKQNNLKADIRAALASFGF